MGNHTKITAIALAMISIATTSAGADDWRYRRHQEYHHRGNGGSGWVAPALGGLLLGGIIAGSIYGNQPAPPRVVYYDYPPNNPPRGYQWVQVVDPNCNCYRFMLAPY